jgi:hypothetical protein
MCVHDFNFSGGGGLDIMDERCEIMIHIDLYKHTRRR